QLDIRWKSNTIVDEISRSCLPHEVEIQQSRSSWSLKMQHVATKNNLQSEGFLATLALFLLSSVNIVSSKVLQRLPKTFRDILLDLEKARSDAIHKDDMDILQQLRHNIRAV